MSRMDFGEMGVVIGNRIGCVDIVLMIRAVIQLVDMQPDRLDRQQRYGEQQGQP